MRSYSQKGFALLNVEKCNSCGNHPTPLSNGKTGINRRYTICCISCNKMVGWHNTVDEAVDAWESDQKEDV